MSDPTPSSPLSGPPSNHGPSAEPPAERAGARQSWAARLYLGQAGIKIDQWRRRLFVIAAVMVLVAIASMAIRGFDFGIEFVGGNAFQVPAEVGTLVEVEDAVANAGATVVSGQEIGGGEPQYMIRTLELDSADTEAVRAALATQFGLDPAEISDDRVSAAWGGQITRQALIALAVFLALVAVYLILRFEARAAVAAISGLGLGLVTTAGVYSLVGFEVTPATVIGFLTIMGFGLYDSVVAFDKVHENTKDITASNTETYGEAANLAVNQVMIRSINTSVVALLPVGGLLFIGAGLLGAGTLKDLGLVLFVGMAVSFYSSLFFAAPLLIELKTRQPRFWAHTQRVLAKRAALANREARQGRSPDEPAAPEQPGPALVDPSLIELAGAAPKVGSRPTQSRRGGRRRGGSGSKR
jgi:preprotein translocase subunit SecF